MDWLGFQLQTLLLFLGFQPCSQDIKDWEAPRTEATEAASPPHSVSHPMNFKTPQSFMLTNLLLSGTFSIYFLFKTNHEDGLIMYASGSRVRNRKRSDDLYAFKGDDGSETFKDHPDQSRSAFKNGRPKDFLALELVGGAIRYAYRMGGVAGHLLANQEEGTLADNRWHSVGLLRPTLKQHILKVDDVAKFDNLGADGRSTLTFDMSEEFYIGGVPAEHLLDLPADVLTTRGFQGCLASLDLDGSESNLLELGKAVVYEEHQRDVTLGCKDPVRECTEESCANGGNCVPGWDSFHCDCSLTTFVGARCQEDGLTYLFSGGYMTLNLERQHLIDLKQQEVRHKVVPTRSEDKMALGLVTNQRRGELIRIISSDDPKIFISLSLNKGRPVVKHGVDGSKFEFRSEVRVDDVTYHVITFVRSNYFYNSTLQVDGISTGSQIYTAQDGFLPENGCKVTIGRGKRRKKVRSRKKQEPTRIIDAYNNNNNNNNKNVINSNNNNNNESDGDIYREKRVAFHGYMAGLTINGINLLEVAAKGDDSGGVVSMRGNISLELRPIVGTRNRSR